MTVSSFVMTSSSWSMIFLGTNDAQLQQAIKEIQDLGLNIEDQGHPADYVGVSIKSFTMDPTSSPSVPWLTPSSTTLKSMTQGPSQSQPRFPYDSMPLRMSLHLTSTSTTGLLWASSTTWPKPLIQTSCMPSTRSPSTHQTHVSHMVKQSSIWFPTWRRLVR